MASINTVTTASKELRNKVIFKIQELISDLPAAKGTGTAQAASESFRIFVSNPNEYNLAEPKGNIPRKKLDLLDLDGAAFIVICQTINKPPTMSRGTVVPKMHKECLITTGATAAFAELVAAALSPESLAALAKHGFTKLTFQVGDSMDKFRDVLPPKDECFGMEIVMFDFKQEGLSEDMMACRAVDDKSLEGMVITHAGAGTILDAMRMALPIIVVPNLTLLENHQEELADELVRQGYVTKGSVLNLPQAIDTATEKAKESHISNSQQRPSQTNGIASMIDSLVGYEVDMDDDDDDDEEGGVRLYPDEDMERDLGREAQVRSMLD